jgi:hypothetical protein
VENLTEKQQAKIPSVSTPATPATKVNVAWPCYQQFRSIYHATPSMGRQIAAKVLN